MMKRVRRRALFCVLILVVLIVAAEGVTLVRQKQLGSIFFVDSTTAKKMRMEFLFAKNGGERIKILFVPGHDAEDSGAAFKNITELGLNLELGAQLQQLFTADKRFDAILAQNILGYHPVLWKYFSEKENEILEFRRQKHLGMYSVQQTGYIKSNVPVEHNNAPENAVTRLYGMNKWANENKIDLVLHLHFNDNGGRDLRSADTYSGFAVYVPDHQYSNASASKIIAESVYMRLQNRLAKSDLPPEKDGIIEDQQLIGLGASNSLDGASLFIEYSYIYEPQFQNLEVRKLWMKEIAFQTYLGVVDFFDSRKFSSDETAVLPYFWKQDLKYGLKNDPDVFALQTALLLEGVYPPAGFTKNECPLSGTYFDCTRGAVLAFQKKYHLSQTGNVDRLTRAQLSVLYGE